MKLNTVIETADTHSGLMHKPVDCPLQVGEELLPQAKEFKYLGVLFTSEGKMEREMDRRIGAASADLRALCQSNPHLWS